MSRLTGALAAAKSVARDSYAWPGGYPRMLIMGDGECICPACIKKEWRQIVSACLGYTAKDWEPVAAAINWEDPNLTCAHCGERIESAYGEEQES